MTRTATTLALLTSFALPAYAQEEAVCMQTVELEAALIDWYNETPVAAQDDGSYIWASGIGGTWTIVTYETDGTSCTLAQGDNWAPGLDSDMLIARLDLTDS